jgi:hypothetical protein
LIAHDPAAQERLRAAWLRHRAVAAPAPARKAVEVAIEAGAATRRDGTAWHLDPAADDSTRIRAAVAIAAVMTAEQAAPLAIGQVKDAVCRAFGLARPALEAPGRQHAVPRHLAMALARRATRLSLAEIGRRFGGRDHSTVRAAVRKGEGRVAPGAKANDE